MSKSIVTFQLGNYSNFIGSHFWNLHEFDFEQNKSRSDFLDDDVTFCEGLTPNTNNVTFTPRLISWDWKQNAGPRIIDDVYEESDVKDDEIPQSRRNIKSLTAPSFGGNVEVYSGFSEEELSSNKTYDIPNKSDYTEWNEYAFCHYHHKTFNWLPKLYRSLDSTNCLLYSQGQDLFNSIEMNEKIIDQTRYFVEKCDYLQGFQIICDCNDGFSGFTMELTNYLQDEFSSRHLISFPTSSPLSCNDYNQKFNTAFLFAHLNQFSGLWSPISLNYDRMVKHPELLYKDSDYWTSSILAMGLKSLLLPSISLKYRNTLTDYASIVSDAQNKMCDLFISLPFPLKTDLIDCLNNNTSEDIFIPVNPYLHKVSNCSNIFGCIYGVNNAHVDFNMLKYQNNPYKNCNSVDEIMQNYINQQFNVSSVRYFYFPHGIPLKHPFPKLFNEHKVGINNGYIRNWNDENTSFSEPKGILPKSVPMSSLLVSAASGSVNLKLDKMYEELKEAMFKFGRMSTELQRIEKDEIDERLELFKTML